MCFSKSANTWAWSTDSSLLTPASRSVTSAMVA